jgi:hypothetical protein
MTRVRVALMAAAAAVMTALVMAGPAVLAGITASAID